MIVYKKGVTSCCTWVPIKKRCNFGLFILLQIEFSKFDNYNFRKKYNIILCYNDYPL